MDEAITTAQDCTTTKIEEWTGSLCVPTLITHLTKSPGPTDQLDLQAHIERLNEHKRRNSFNVDTPQYMAYPIPQISKKCSHSVMAGGCLWGDGPLRCSDSECLKKAELGTEEDEINACIENFLTDPTCYFYPQYYTHTPCSSTNDTTELEATENTLIEDLSADSQTSDAESTTSISPTSTITRENEIATGYSSDDTLRAESLEDSECTQIKLDKSACNLDSVENQENCSKCEFEGNTRREDKTEASQSGHDLNPHSNIQTEEENKDVNKVEETIPFIASLESEHNTTVINMHDSSIVADKSVMPPDVLNTQKIQIPTANKTCPHDLQPHNIKSLDIARELLETVVQIDMDDCSNLSQLSLDDTQRFNNNMINQNSFSIVNEISPPSEIAQVNTQTPTDTQLVAMTQDSPNNIQHEQPQYNQIHPCPQSTHSDTITIKQSQSQPKIAGPIKHDNNNQHPTNHINHASDFTQHATIASSKPLATQCERIQEENQILEQLLEKLKTQDCFSQKQIEQICYQISNLQLSQYRGQQVNQMLAQMTEQTDPMIQITPLTGILLTQIRAMAGWMTTETQALQMPRQQFAQYPSHQLSQRPVHHSSGHFPNQQLVQLPFQQCGQRPAQQLLVQQGNQISAHPPGQLSAHSSGQLSAQASCQLLAQASGQLSTQASGQLSAHSSGQLSAQASGQLLAQASGQLLTQASGQLSAHSSGQLSAQSSRQPSTHQICQLLLKLAKFSAELKSERPAEPHDDPVMKAHRQ